MAQAMIATKGEDAEARESLRLAKGRASDRKEWLTEEGNKAEILE